ncbi:Rpn family recombination-promoting nuclease/putative transposase [Myxacorys almedinensis]|uniref:Rpn family recombination-promoting nuclease/putative transposase n=1 Tax=Myxacorys almedinensis A TaxID=2690445 RepID=A0A8J8CMM6_9CYAN|nr:Rpn family recombination-promoting nuclease/putative transposase [Myxacorys almedinensis]NDJ17447.1 Rpn family recombination-promoting nuclease/putative transposase [Myxacorys almedinensis A]
MRRDPLFYKLFQQSPELLFDLIETKPDNASDYRFDSVAVKEPKFEIDGVFLPPENQIGAVYFCEIQMQKDERLYERLLAESTLYFYRNRDRFNDWQAVIIYPSRGLEQSDLYPHRTFLDGEQVHRVYLDELGEVRDLPVTVGAMVLTIVNEAEAPEAARDLIARTEQAALTPEEKRDIIDIVTSILVYKLKNLSRLEIRRMLGLDLTQEPRAIREAKEEGREEVRGQEAIALITRQLTRRLGQELSEEMKLRLSVLPLPLLEDLSEALLDFTSLVDLEAWLEVHPMTENDRS